jgi:hypothetical protein
MRKRGEVAAFYEKLDNVFRVVADAIQSLVEEIVLVIVLQDSRLFSAQGKWARSCGADHRTWAYRR